MRLLVSLKNSQEAANLSTYLVREGIPNELETIKDDNWGSTGYGDATYRIWVIDEDHFQKAMQIAQEYHESPKDPRFIQPVKKTPTIDPHQVKIKPNRNTKKQLSTPSPWSRDPMGAVTFYIILLCTLLFVYTEMTTPIITHPPQNLPLTPFYSAPLKKDLLYDYPHAYEILDKLANVYGVEKLQNPSDLPPEGAYLLKEYENTPYWKGYYDIFLAYLKKTKPNLAPDAPLFEKIHEGEYWRLFSPALLHYDIFHILFNMIWLVILGKQIEQRLGIVKYIIFILITGIFSNTAQYLMGGSNFLGFSGILCAMLTFIWARQRTAAWEGYFLQPSTMGFMAFFILIMFFLQFSSFFIDLYWNQVLSPGIANTAHLSGALCGYLLGKLKIFHWNNPTKL